MAELSFHPLVQKDLRRILEHYGNEGGQRLADRFFAEAEETIEQIEKVPERFHFLDEIHRRANFRNFPYHFVFEMKPGGARVTILRHHKRQPKYGMRRR